MQMPRTRIAVLVFFHLKYVITVVATALRLVPRDAKLNIPLYTVHASAKEFDTNRTLHITTPKAVRK